MFILLITSFIFNRLWVWMYIDIYLFRSHLFLFKMMKEKHLIIIVILWTLERALRNKVNSMYNEKLFTLNCYKFTDKMIKNNFHNHFKVKSLHQKQLHHQFRCFHYIKWLWCHITSHFQKLWNSRSQQTTYYEECWSNTVW